MYARCGWNCWGIRLLIFVREMMRGFERVCCGIMARAIDSHCGWNDDVSWASGALEPIVVVLMSGHMQHIRHKHRTTRASAFSCI